MKSQKRRSRAAESKPDKRADGFRKRTTTPLGFLGAVASIAADPLVFLKVWGRHDLDPGIRETLMLAVARFNASKYCSWAHREWAMINGVSEEDLAHLEQLDSAHFDRKMWLAISFARELVAANFGPVPKKMMREIQAHYTAEEIEQITLVAKVMDTLNLGSNTFEAFLSRLSGNASPNGHVVDEAIMSAAFCCALALLLPYFARSSKRSTDELAQRMVEYTAKMDGECMADQSAT